MCCHSQSQTTTEFSDIKALRIAKFLTDHVGCSLNMAKGKPFSGYMVSIEAGPTYMTEKVEKDRKLRWDTYVDYTYRAIDLNIQAIADWVRRVGSNDHYFGSWRDENTGKVYIDISECIYDLDEALALARSRNELAIWDVKNNCEIRL